VPSALSLLVTNGELGVGAFPRLRTIIFAGEVFPTPYLTQLMALVPHATYWNWYGPTETNVCTAYRVPEPPGADAAPVPIGTVVDGDEAIVVDEAERPIEAGDEGELLVTGGTVTAGYWGDPERTAARLGSVPALVERGDERSWYRTGDLVVDLGEGVYEFRGRRDHQVKSRGYRIELGEIEAALHRHPHIADAAVVAVPDDLVTNRLRAFVVAPTEVSDTDIARHLTALVPSYMVPERIERLPVLPRTSTGKVDRQALQALARD
jgi:acyl-coenzyme A synthetase/AMP-(fatty) acid ligase